jgi:hypothetical protein
MNATMTKNENKGENKMTDLAIANTIKDQIGGKALFMIGAKNLMGHENGLSFRVGRNAKKVNYVKITLNGRDLYDLEFGWIRGMKYTVKATETDYYFDMLHSAIEEHTGMYTSL